MNLLSYSCPLETGGAVKHTNGVAGQPQLLHSDDIDYLLRLIRQRPDWFLDELLSLLKNNQFIAVHYVTIHNALIRAGVSLKKTEEDCIGTEGGCTKCIYQAHLSL